MEKNRIYAAIDLKSFYASVECIERDLDPLGTHLVVADASRKSYEIRKQFVLQCHHRSKPMGFLEEPDCLKLYNV